MEIKEAFDNVPGLLIAHLAHPGSFAGLARSVQLADLAKDRPLVRYAPGHTPPDVAVVAGTARRTGVGDEVVVSALQQRFNTQSGVNIDTEMSNLITLQNAYAANARVLSAVKDMLDTLMRM